MTDELFRSLGVEITLPDPEDFNIIKETLSRIGIPSYKNMTLTQTCHIFHRQGKYAIMHFKEMLAFDGKDVNLEEDDIARRNLIVKLLDQWELINELNIKLEPIADQKMIKIVSSKDKANWEFKQKYSIGRN